MSADRMWVRRNVDMDRMDVPTPIDPADIRPGDVVEFRKRVNVTRVDEDGWIFSDTRGFALGGDGATWHLIHRPDPDEEAVDALAKNVLDIGNPDAYDRENIAMALVALREQGWDVVRRHLAADLRRSDAERVSQVPPTPDRPLERDWAAYCERLTREAALRAVVREDEDDEG